MKKKMILLSCLLLLVFSITSEAAFWEASVTQVATIGPTESSGFGRLLFRFELPDQLKGVTIDYAELVFTATPDTGSSYICLMGAYPVTKRWESEDLAWSDGWTTPGGDFAGSIYSSCLIGGSAGRLTRMDITDIAQMWVDGTLANHGLILIPLEDPDRFLKLHNNSQLPPDVKAKVRIFYSAPRRE